MDANPDLADFAYECLSRPCVKEYRYRLARTKHHHGLNGFGLRSSRVRVPVTTPSGVAFSFFLKIYSGHGVKAVTSRWAYFSASVVNAHNAYPYSRTVPCLLSISLLVGRHTPFARRGSTKPTDPVQYGGPTCFYPQGSIHIMKTSKMVT